VVKGTSFVNLLDAGDPVERAIAYERQGADEIVFLDISATPTGSETMLARVSETADRLFVPLTVGGGVRCASDVGRVLRAGADKVAVNSAAVREPTLLSEAAARFGSQCIVASIDARARLDGGWEVCIAGGRVPTGLDAVWWAARCAALGAGEILITSIDRDGGRRGYDIQLTRAIAAAVSVPVVASGGAGTPADVRNVFEQTNAAAALVAGVLHDGTATIGDIKRELTCANVPVRNAA
jgi:cyclase